ncbi:hypothetical protein I3842_07G103700 [Carya illinoinensis]|uniref:NAC domain-containing protein n=1 Tax=Carya illinoinensis TaxID=32201 RepID=A0A922JDN4_CARIL|nr:hypothetical protein I3842_07G103700 [Carya illinoinensis]
MRGGRILKPGSGGQEILLYHLQNRIISGIPNPEIGECDLYGEKEPWEIWDQGSNKNLQEDLLVFTKLKKKTAKASRVDRTIGTGSWKAEDVGVEIYWRENSILDGMATTLFGMKKRFHYEGRSSSVDDDRLHWIMYEYSLDADHHAQCQDYVICRMKRIDDSGKKSKSRKRESTEIMEKGKEIYKRNHGEVAQVNNIGIGSTTAMKAAAEPAGVNSSESRMGNFSCSHIVTTRNTNELLMDIKSFGEELTGNHQADQTMEEPDDQIEMIDTKRFVDVWNVNGCELLKK